MDNPPWRADSKRQLSFSSDRGTNDAEAKRQRGPDTTSQHEAEILASETGPYGEIDLAFFGTTTEYSGVSSVEDMMIDTHSDPASTATTVNESPYDTCFGAVIEKAVSSFKGRGGVKQVPVTVAAWGYSLKLSFFDTKKYAGIIKNAALVRLLQEFSVTLTATLLAPTTKQNTFTASKSSSIDIPEECPVRIVVYGLMTDCDAIGEILGDAGLCFQHPLAIEYEHQVAYHNPHYLLRPGSEMPKLEELSLAETSREAEKNLLDESDKGILMRLFDEAGNSGMEASMEPSARLRSTLKEHQITALAQFTEIEAGVLIDKKFPSLWELSSGPNPPRKYRNKVTGVLEMAPRPVRGGILADEMGLGKSLTILALICWSLDSMTSQRMAAHDQQTRSCRTTLLVTPKSTIHNWIQECEKHIHSGSVTLVTYHGYDRLQLSEKLEHSDIILTTYETMRQDWITNGPLYSKKWHRIVLDEAHHIKSRSSQVFQAACAIQAHYRWCLTGTPIQNSLDDFAALVTFVGVPPFINKGVFDYWITKPIKEKSAFGLQRLGLLIKAICVRRTHKLLLSGSQLPQRRERTVWVELTPEDRALYRFFQQKTADIASGFYRQKSGNSATNRKDTNILSLINFLRLICDHGELLLSLSALEAWKTRNDRSIDWEMMQATQKACELCGGDLDDADTQTATNPDFPCSHPICGRCQEKSNSGAIESESKCSKCTAQMANPPSNSTPLPILPSPKVKALIDNLRQEQARFKQSGGEIPAKSVIFSSWTKMLDLTQESLEASGFVCQRIDGQTGLKERGSAIHEFNSNDKCTVMLASIGSAGEGIDLTAANNIHLLEPHWNPMAESQAIARVHRMGQRREVLTTRYLTRDTIETYVQWIQRDKLRLIDQSLDSQPASQPTINDQRWKKLRSSLGYKRAGSPDP